MWSQRCDSIFLDFAPSSCKIKRLKSMRYNDGYVDRNWCAMADDSMMQGSLCPALTLTEWVRIPVGCYFFFLLFSNQNFTFFVITIKPSTFSFFYGLKYFVSKVRSLLQTALQRIEDQHIEAHVKLKILWQSYPYSKLLMYRGFKISNVTRMVQYQSENALSPFVDTVKQMRIEATLEGDNLQATTVTCH